MKSIHCVGELYFAVGAKAALPGFNAPCRSERKPRAMRFLALAWQRAMRLCCCAALIIASTFGTAAHGQPSSRPDGAKDYRSWIAAHPTVRVGVASEFAPYYFAIGSGRYEGFVVDLLERLVQGTGLRLEYHRYASFGEVLQAMQRREIDMTPFTSESPQRQEYMTFVQPLFSTQTVVVADSRVPDLSLDETFSRYRIAVERGSAAAEVLARRYPQAKVLPFDTVESAILATASGDADLCVTFRQVATYYMEKHFTANLLLRGTLATPSTALGPAVRKDLPELAALLNDAVVQLNADEVAELTAKWLPRSVVSATPGPAAPLSDAQRAWVRQHGGVKLGFDAAFSPITFTSAAGGFDGLAADITRLLARKAGLIVSYEQAGSFADVFDAARQGRIDMVVGAARNVERSREFDFVGPILRVPTVVVAANDQSLVEGLETPGARRLALLRDHFLAPMLRSRHPNLTLVEFETQAAALQAVRRGDADLALGNMKVVNQLLESEHVGALKTVSVVHRGDSELYFAVPKAQAQLTAVLRAALDAATPAELAAIEDRWLRVEFTAGVRWQRAAALVAAVLVLTGLIVGTLWHSNRRLRAATRTFNAARQLAEEQVDDRARFTAYLSHELRGSLGGLSGGLTLLEGGKLAPERANALTSAMRGSAATLLDLCERTLDVERWLKGDVDVRPVEIVLAEAIDSALTPAHVQAELKGLVLSSQLDFDPDLRVECDPVRLTQVLQNLVGNAIKFTQHGTVKVIATMDPEGPESAKGLVELRLVVSDTGPGISSIDQVGLFKPFGQGDAGKRSRSGAGLGLSIVSQIVAAMGGKVWLERSMSQGSVFVATLGVRRVAGAASSTSDSLARHA